MSVLTKIRHTKNLDIQVIVNGKETHFYKIPIEKYEEVTIDLYQTDLYQKSLHNIGGEKKYQKSALMVKTARLKKGFSQKKLAELIGIERTNLVHIEKARRPVGKILAKKFAKILESEYQIFLSN